MTCDLPLKLLQKRHGLCKSNERKWTRESPSIEIYEQMKPHALKNLMKNERKKEKIAMPQNNHKLEGKIVPAKW